MEGKITDRINLDIADVELAKKNKRQRAKRTLLEKIEAAAHEKIRRNCLNVVHGKFREVVHHGILYYVKWDESIAPAVTYSFKNQNEPVNASVHEQEIDLAELAKRDQFAPESEEPHTEEDKPRLSSEHVLEGISDKDRSIHSEDKDKKEGDSIYHLQDALRSDQLSNSQREFSDKPEEQGLPKESPYDIINLTDQIIKPFKDDFFLAFHPHPIVDGHIILFQKCEPDTTLFEERQTNSVFYKDCSKFVRTHKGHASHESKKTSQLEPALTEPREHQVPVQEEDPQEQDAPE